VDVVANLSWRKAFDPSFEEGWLRPINKMSRYLKQGVAGEISLAYRMRSDLPGRADTKVT